MWIIEFYGILVISSVIFSVSNGRVAVKNSQIQRYVDSDEPNSEEVTTNKDSTDNTNMYRLDFTDTSEEIGPFASYQFEKKGVSSTSSSTASGDDEIAAPLSNSSSTAATVNAATVTTVKSVGTAKPGTITPTPTANPEEDEIELIVSTTPFKLDSLGNVVTITNNEDESSEEQCDEGELKKVKCNTCVCTDGVFHCSKKPCPEKDEEIDEDENNQRFGIFNDDAAVQEIMNKVTVLGSIGYTSGLVGHGPGGGHKNNKWSWKKKQPQTTAAVLPDCTSGMTKQIDCNNCICASGKWACTKTSCIALTLREKASYSDGSIIKNVEGLKENHHLDEDCIEGTTRQANCNQCVCHYNSWSCTSRQCSSTPAPSDKIQEIEEACQLEGDVKSKECNICKCRRGIWQCGTNNCMKFGVAKIPYVPPKFRTGVKKPVSS